MKRTILFLLTVVSVFQISAQQKITGNVVEYFGKERFERTDEGVVTMKLTEGWAAPTTITTGMFFPIGDQTAWELFTGNFKNPYKGDTIANDYGGMLMPSFQGRRPQPRDDEDEDDEEARRERRPMPPMPPAQPGDRVIKWQKVTADSTGKFQSPVMRRGVLYTEWESAASEILLLQASGEGRTMINGVPHEGDSFDFAFTLIPFKAAKGINSFVFTPGRFGYVQASIIKPEKPVMFTHRDMTLPDIIKGETTDKWGAVRLINATEKELTGMTLECTLPNGDSRTTKVPPVMDLFIRKIPFTVPSCKDAEGNGMKALLTLKDKAGKVVDTMSVPLRVRSITERHERTYLARTDGSVQYYAVTPSTVEGDGQALVLSVHGAGVEARNQSGAYSQKDWVHIACATGRRPYGFNWESIGRLDALDVFEDAQRLYKTDLQRSYLTGHSMGGHGTWILGATFPDKWAAIAPCAGYPDIASYGRSILGMDSSQVAMLFEKAANEGRALKMRNNYLQSGIYVFHGGADMVVPTSIAREMRKVLGEFHPDFCYAEYPGGSHWFSNESVDWKPIFEFFRRHTIPQKSDVRAINFSTASPSISGSDYWLTVLQQEHPTEISNADFAFRMRNRVLKGKTTNIHALQLDVDNMPDKGKVSLDLDGTQFKLDTTGKVTFIKDAEGKWSTGTIAPFEKNNLRGGGFKEVFNNNVIFVYATGGTKEENDWYKAKARFDAESFLYKANGSNDVISDKEFLKSDYSGRNVVLYGNAENNKAWDALLGDCPVRLTGTEITWGKDAHVPGDDIGVYFVYPRKGDLNSLVGVIGGTGIKGAQATMQSDYISGVTGYPDIVVFSLDALKDGFKGIRSAGYFGNDWTLQNGDFIVFE